MSRVWPGKSSDVTRQRETTEQSRREPDATGAAQGPAGADAGDAFARAGKLRAGTWRVAFTRGWEPCRGAESALALCCRWIAAAGAGAFCDSCLVPWAAQELADSTGRACRPGAGGQAQ